LLANRQRWLFGRRAQLIQTNEGIEALGGGEKAHNSIQGQGKLPVDSLGPASVLADSKIFL